MVVINKRQVQIYLRLDQIRSLKTLSKERGVSMAELIRQGVDRLLSEVPPERDPLWDIIGIVESAPPDLAEKLDEHLAQTIEEENRAWREKSS